MPQLPGNYTSTDSDEFDRLAEQVERHGVGGFVVSIGLPHSYAAKLNALQRRARVPLLIASDMESGPGMRLAGIVSMPRLLPQGGGTSFPPAMAFGAAGSDSLAEAAGAVIAREARAVGVHLTFGPVLDVNSNPANPIINVRSFGEDPGLVARLGEAYIRGARRGGLLVAAKHFPGHGDTQADSHLELPALPAGRARLDSIELPPFRAAVRAGTDAVMTAHIAMTGIEGDSARPATMSRGVLSGLLRAELGFRGLIITDAMNMGAVVRGFGAGQALIEAFEAGADILLMPLDVPQAIEALLSAVQSGRISEARLDESVRRVLDAKARAGLPAGRLVRLDSVDRAVGGRGHEALARLVAERAITLARDDRGLVPLAATAATLLVISYGPPDDLVAGRTFAAALSEGGRRVTAIRLDARSTAADYDAISVLANSADLVIAAAFVAPAEFSGAISAAAGFPALLERLAAVRPVIGVSFGSPYLVSEFPSVPAYLLAWGDADVCQIAAARALLGHTAITGRLPVGVPPLFARGHGLRRGRHS